MIWAVSQRRMGLVVSMLVTIGILVGGGLYVFPEWIQYNYLQILGFFAESFPASPSAVLWTWMPDAGPRVMAFVAVGLGIWMLVEWWKSLGKDVRWFLWTSALTIVVTNLTERMEALEEKLTPSLSNHVLLVVPFVLVFSVWVQRWKQNGTRLSAVVMVLILAAEWGLAGRTMDAGLSAQAAPVMFFVVPVLALLLLYWSRYWALSSVRMKVSHLEALRRL